jgi:hypothetical protein
MSTADYMTEVDNDALAAQRQLEHSLMQASPFTDHTPSRQGRVQDLEGVANHSGYNPAAPGHLASIHGNGFLPQIQATPVATRISNVLGSRKETSRLTGSFENTQGMRSSPGWRMSAEDEVQLIHTSPITPPESLNAPAGIVTKDDDHDHVRMTSEDHVQPQIIIESSRGSFRNPSMRNSPVKYESTILNPSSPLTSVYSSVVSSTPPLDSTTPTPTPTSEQNANSRRSSRTPKQTQLFSFEHLKSETSHKSPTVIVSTPKDIHRTPSSSSTKIVPSPIAIEIPPKSTARKSSTPPSFEPPSKRPRRTSSQTMHQTSSLPVVTVSPLSRSIAAVLPASTQEEKDGVLARELQGMQFGLREGRSRKSA